MELRSISGVNLVVSDETLGCIFAHLDSAADRRAMSQVCKQWKRVDANTRKHVQIANCYSVAPAALSRRFPNLESVKIKGKPRAFDFELLAPNWGGYARPWVLELASSYAQKLQSLWLRRMVVSDADLKLLASSCSESLYTLKLDKCSGFTAVGLAAITSSCRSLKDLYMEECEIHESEGAGGWLHELAKDSYNLEQLNFQYTTGLEDISVDDLEDLVENCKSLRSLKVSEVDIMDMERVVNRTSSLEELGTGCFNEPVDPQNSPPTIDFPKSIIALSGLYALTDLALPMISIELLANLRKLDLKFVMLSQEGHCQILKYCFKLEVLEARNLLGDAGLIIVSRTCKNLRRVRIDDGGDGFLSPVGIIPVAQNCVKLQFLVMYVADLDNATLITVGKYCPDMKDCRFVLLSTLEVIVDLPLDEGVKCLLQGCQKMTRFALYVRHGGLTDRGMAYIGEYGGRLKWVLLGCAGESDLGLYNLATGCQALERLEMRDCPVTESGLATAAIMMKNSLKFMWVQGYHATEAGGSILARSRPFWNVEICLGSLQAPGQLLAYHSLAGPRSDCPPEVMLLNSTLIDLPIHHGNGGL